MSYWTPRDGMDPSPNESLVLYATMRLWAEYRHAYGPTVSQLLFGELSAWGRTRSTVRAHLLNLETKGHVSRWDRTRHSGDLTWQPTRRGRLYVFECLLPELDKDTRFRRDHLHLPTLDVTPISVIELAMRMR